MGKFNTKDFSIFICDTCGTVLDSRQAFDPSYVQAFLCPRCAQMLRDDIDRYLRQRNIKPLLAHTQ